jgi:hypothetical protein
MGPFSPTGKETEKEKGSMAEATHAPPLPLKRRGLRRAKAQYCQRPTGCGWSDPTFRTPVRQSPHFAAGGDGFLRISELAKTGESPLP